MTVSCGGRAIAQPKVCCVRVCGSHAAAGAGLGEIADSGLGVAPDYAHFDACRRFGYVSDAPERPTECLSGEVCAAASASRSNVRRLARGCTPERPLGATMVSSEGACAAYYRYRRPVEEPVWTDRFALSCPIPDAGGDIIENRPWRRRFADAPVDRSNSSDRGSDCRRMVSHMTGRVFEIGRGRLAFTTDSVRGAAVVFSGVAELARLPSTAPLMIWRCAVPTAAFECWTDPRGRVADRATAPCCRI